MADVAVKDLIEIVEKRLFSAGKELFIDAMSKLGLSDKKFISPEDSICIFQLMKEGMHTDISKNAIDKCIVDATKLLTS